MFRTENVGDKIIYSAEMDDVMLVDHHENGIHCDVIFFGGSDYGAYLSSKFVSISSKKFEEVLGDITSLYQLKDLLGYGICDFVGDSKREIHSAKVKDVLELEKSLSKAYTERNPFESELAKSVPTYTRQYHRQKDQYIENGIREFFELSDKIKD